MTIRRQPAAMSEDTIQRAVMDHLARRAAPGTVFWHTPNGGTRNPVEAARLRGQGVMPGIPDVLILAGGRLYALELKAARGVVSPAQARMLERLAAAGATTAVAHGLDQALGILDGWGMLSRGRLETAGSPTTPGPVALGAAPGAAPT